MQNKLYTIRFFSPSDARFAASPWAAIAQLVGFTKLLERFELPEKRELNSQKRGSWPPPNPYLYTEHDIYAMEYLHWPAWAGCLAVLPPSSCKPAH